MKKTFWIIVDRKNKIGGISTGKCPEERFVFTNKEEAEYYALKWDGDKLKKATLTWD